MLTVTGKNKNHLKLLVHIGRRRSEVSKTERVFGEQWRRVNVDGALKCWGVRSIKTNN